MSAATPPNESLADAVALIAVCKRSVALMEIAFALQVVAISATEVPEEARRNRFFARVLRRMSSPAWVAAARAALGNEGLGRVAGCFRAACFEYATPKTAAFYDDEEWLRGIQVYYVVEENMRVLADMILELMRLPEVDVEPRQVPASAPPAPVPTPQPAMPPARPWMVAPPAEWAIPIALIAIGKAKRNPLWVSFGAAVGCLSGFWSREPKLAADPQFSVAAKKMLEAPRGFEMASALLRDAVLRTASQAMMMRWHAVAGGKVSSDGLREATAADAELAVRVEAVLRATCMVMQTLVGSGRVPSAEVASEAPSKAPSAAVRPPALRFVPAGATRRRAPLTRERQCPLRARSRHRIPNVDAYAMQPPQPRCRSPTLPA